MVGIPFNDVAHIFAQFIGLVTNANQRHTPALRTGQRWQCDALFCFALKIDPDQNLTRSGSYEGNSLFAEVDEEALKVVTRVTEGDYFYEAWAKDLNAAY